MTNIFNTTRSIKIQTQDLQMALEHALQNPLKNAYVISNLTQLKQDCSIAIDGENGAGYAVASYYMDLPFYNVNLMVRTAGELKTVIDKLRDRHSELKEQPIYGLYDEKTAQLVEGQFEATRRHVEIKMALTAAEVPHINIDHVQYRLERLTIDDMMKISQLYSLVPAMAWSPKLLELGPYYGIYWEDQLVSIAGVQFVTNWVAEVGNIVTHFRHRRNNLANYCTKEVIENLRRTTEQIFLCVNADNDGAIRLYEKMGFEKVDELTLLQYYI
jgi:ribosomal protein S18 acetylase RimI-like enzyme